MIIDEENELLTVRELVTYLKCNPTTPYGWKHRGVGPKVTQVGRSVRYRRSDVEAWLIKMNAPEEKKNDSQLIYAYLLK